MPVAASINSCTGFPGPMYLPSSQSPILRDSPCIGSGTGISISSQVSHAPGEPVAVKVIPGICGAIAAPLLSTPKIPASISSHVLDAPLGVAVVCPSGTHVPSLVPNIASLTVLPILLNWYLMFRSISFFAHLLKSFSDRGSPATPMVVLAVFNNS